MNPEILLISSYPPRECGIATYTQDLVQAMNKTFHQCFNITICALESAYEKHAYASDVKYRLNTDEPESFIAIAEKINENPAIKIVLLQHEFGFFQQTQLYLLKMLQCIHKPVVIVYHTVLPKPSLLNIQIVQELSAEAARIIVMTKNSSEILINDYLIAPEKITIIPHGTHLVEHISKNVLKKRYQLTGKKVLSTFGLLSSGKGIETTLAALPAIIAVEPDVVFLIIGKTHPAVVKQEGEKYRNSLEEMVKNKGIGEHVIFINYFLELPQLLEYLQMTDVYLFTSKDPNQAVSGTFSYAISCGCPIVSTPIPHAKEVLKADAGIIIGFNDELALATAVITLLGDEHLRKTISSNGLHRMASTAWENTAIAHAKLIESISNGSIRCTYALPPIKLNHLKKLTTPFGMIQFSKINQPDLESGYTLDDNARALIAICKHYELTRTEKDLPYMACYYHFINYCLLPSGRFLNYIDQKREFTVQNGSTNLEDANGRAIWALGYLCGMSVMLPMEYAHLRTEAAITLETALINVEKMHSSRAMAFVIKGLFYMPEQDQNDEDRKLLIKLANRLVQMYRHESSENWNWFESYLTYANSVLPEAMLCAWQLTGDIVYRDIARNSFDFLLSKIFFNSQINVVSNKNWLYENYVPVHGAKGGEQPIDVAYTILALDRFYKVFADEKYRDKMTISFNWFLGENHLQQVIYNPCTGGCYDGLEDHAVNLNQGAESTVSYLMARLCIEKLLRHEFNTKKRQEMPLLVSVLDADMVA